MFRILVTLCLGFSATRAYADDLTTDYPSSDIGITFDLDHAADDVGRLQCGVSFTYGYGNLLKLGPGEYVVISNGTSSVRIDGDTPSDHCYLVYEPSAEYRFEFHRTNGEVNTGSKIIFPIATLSPQNAVFQRGETILFRYPTTHQLRSSHVLIEGCEIPYEQTWDDIEHGTFGVRGEATRYCQPATGRATLGLEARMKLENWNNSDMQGVRISVGEEIFTNLTLE